MTIHWEEVLKQYNQEHRNDYKSVPEMLIDLYGSTQSSRRLSALLNVSDTSIRRKIKDIGAGHILRPKGGDNRSGTGSAIGRFLLIPVQDLKGMTIQDVAIHCRCTNRSAYRFFRVTDRNLEDLEGTHKGVIMPKRRVNT